jgi:hypothetical protein
MIHDIAAGDPATFACARDQVEIDTVVRSQPAHDR